MVYTVRRQQVLGQNELGVYRRYLPQQAPINPVTLAVIGGSVALVVTVLIVKQVKKKRKKK